MYFNTLYMVICVTGICAWCRMVHPVISPAQLRRFFKLTEWIFLPWPSLSPDLNPIEHIWDVIGREVSRRALEMSWAITAIFRRRMEQNCTCLRYVASMRSRCQAVILANSGHNRFWSINCKSQWNFSFYYDEYLILMQLNEMEVV